MPKGARRAGEASPRRMRPPTLELEEEELDVRSRRQAPVAQTESSLMGDSTDVVLLPNHMRSTCGQPEVRNRQEEKSIQKVPSFRALLL